VHETLTLQTSDGPMGVHIVRPDGDGQSHPVVVFFHHGPGLDQPSKDTMQYIADRGYYVISHDRYHRDAEWYTMTPELRKDKDEAQRFFGMLANTTEQMVDRDLAAVLDHIDADPAAASGGMLSCIGYCIGARSVVCTMAWHHDRFGAGVALHPSFCTTDQPDSPHLLVPEITGSMYVAFGSEDTMQSAADNEPFIDAINAMPDGRGEAVVHEGANHGFGVLGSAAYHEAAASKSYERAFSLFSKNSG
jgi:carboxymethylenebutenolidase